MYDFVDTPSAASSVPDHRVSKSSLELNAHLTTHQYLSSNVFSNEDSEQSWMPSKGKRNRATGFGESVNSMAFRFGSVNAYSLGSALARAKPHPRVDHPKPFLNIADFFQKLIGARNSRI